MFNATLFNQTIQRVNYTRFAEVVALLNQTLLNETLLDETLFNKTYLNHTVFHNLTLSEAKLLVEALNWTQGLNWSHPHHSKLRRRPCMAGFAIQGQLDPGRRNYSSIWHDMGQKLTGAGGPSLQRDMRFAINIMGSGFAGALGVPRYLWPYVRLHLNLRFEHYYNVIYHNVALIPTLASAAYYNKKFSSTVVTSLITTTPIIADVRLLSAYKFLDESCVYLQQEGESQVDTVTRVLGMPHQEVVLRRHSLKRLRAKLNYRASLQVKWWVMQALTQEEKEAKSTRAKELRGGREAARSAEERESSGGDAESPVSAASSTSPSPTTPASQQLAT